MHSVTQFTPQLGETSRLDGKLVALYGSPMADSLPHLWTAPDDIFKTVKVHLPPIELLTSNTSWKSGNEEALFTQDANHTTADICKVVHFPYEWVTKVLCDDKTASQTLNYVYYLTFEWATAELEAIQPLMDWLRAASCKAKTSPKNTTETPVCSNWSVSCPNREETHWTRTRIAEFFGNRTSNISQSQLATTTHRQRVVDPMQKISQSSTAELVATVVAKKMLTMDLTPLHNGVQNTTILSSTKEKMSKHRLHRIKGWCGINENSTLPIPTVWEKLDTADNKSDKLSLLNQLCSTCKTSHDQLDLVITERLVQSIINCNLGAGLGYSYANCHHGLTIFSTARQSTEFVAAQLMEEENLREATDKSVSDIRSGKGKPPALATGYYSLLAWFNNYIVVLQILFRLQCNLLISMKRLRTAVVTIRRRNSSYFTRSNITNLLWRIFIDGRIYFSIQTDKEDLQNNKLPVSTLIQLW